MAQTVSIILCDEDRKRLEAIAAGRSCPLKHIRRVNIVLHSADRLPVLEVARRAVPAGKVIHAILDSYATHKHPAVLKRLADHPRWTFHFTPTSACLVERI
jgi:hypothetical protein